MAVRKTLALVVTVGVFAAATLFLMLRETEPSGPVLFPVRNSDVSPIPSPKQEFLPTVTPLEPLPGLISPPSPTNSTLSPTPDDLGNEAEAEDIVEPIDVSGRRDEDYESFLAKLAVPEANMEGSVVPWDLVNFEPLNWTDQDWSLHMNISLSSDSDLACKPTKFGLSEVQAAATFIPKAPFTSCCAKPHNFLHYTNG